MLKRPQVIMKPVIAAVILLAVMSATYERNGVWLNDLSLWGDAAGKSPHNAKSHYGLGYAYACGGDVDSAIAQYETALMINPFYADVHFHLGLVLLHPGKEDLKRAQKEFEAALQIDPQLAKARMFLAYTARLNSAPPSP